MILGIKVKIHWTFYLFALLIGIYSGFSYFILLCMVYGSVLLHEFGHALMARRYGIHTSVITLLPIGGVASLEHIPREPIQEFMITIAGPLVNIVIAIFGYALGIPKLCELNIILAIFNLAPVFPMDGGRIFRATLASLMSHRTATVIAVRFGQVLTVYFVACAFLAGNFMLVLVGSYICVMGHMELKFYEEIYDECCN